MDLNQVTLPCTQYDQSLAFYQTLGFTLIVDSPPRYARFETDKGTTFSLHAEGVSGKQQDWVMYFEVGNVDDTVEALKAKGVVFEADPVDQEWGWREAYTRDPSGNRICIYHAGEYRRFPPWRVQGTHSHG